MNRQNLRSSIDPFTEIVLCRDSDPYPFTDFTQIQFKGPIDILAFAKSWDEALKLVPMFSSHLRVERRGIRHIPFWEYDEEVQNRLIIEDCRHLAKEPFDPMEFSINFHLGRTRRRLNLTCEFPFTGYLIRIFDDRYILSVIYQHSVVDPYKTFKVTTALFALYHEKVKGDQPQWAKSIGMAALARGKKSLWNAPKTTMFTYPLKLIGDSIRWTVKGKKSIRISQLSSMEILDYKKVKGRYGPRVVIEDLKIIEGLLDRAKKNNASLNDLLLAVALKCLTSWNREYNVSPEYFRMTLASSLKGRTDVAESAGAGLSVLEFLARCSESENIDDLILYFMKYRKSLLTDRIDIKLHTFVSQWFSLLRILPLPFRMKYLAPLLLGTPVTFHLSNIGVVWPKIVDGRQTLDSEILSVGDLVIEDMHSCPTFGANVGMGLITRMHNRRFYMNFVFDRFRFRQEEAKELVDRFVKGLYDAAA